MISVYRWVLIFTSATIALGAPVPGVHRDGTTNTQEREFSEAPVEPGLPWGARRFFKSADPLTGVMACGPKGIYAIASRPGAKAILTLTGQPLGELKLGAGETIARLSPSARVALIRGAGVGNLRLEALDGRGTIGGIDLKGAFDARFSENDAFVAVERPGNKIDVHSVGEEKTVSTAEGVKAVRWVSPDGKVLQARKADQKGLQFSLFDNKGHELFPDEKILPTPPAMSQDGKLLAVATAGRVKVFAMPAKKLVRELPAAQATGLRFSADGAFLVVTETGRHIVYEAASGHALGQLATGTDHHTQPDSGSFCGGSRFFAAPIVSDPRAKTPGNRGVYLYDMQMTAGPRMHEEKALALKLVDALRGEDPNAAWRAMWELRARNLPDENIHKLLRAEQKPALTADEMIAWTKNITELSGKRSEAASLELTRLLAKMTRAEVSSHIPSLKAAIAAGNADAKKHAAPLLAAAERLAPEATPEVRAAREAWFGYR